MKEEINR